MPLFRSKAEDKVRKAGFDPARLPPGQYYTDKWPWLPAGEIPDVDLATWTLQVTGEVEKPLTLSFEELKQLPATEVTSDIHCVTRWSRFDARFKGVHWSELAKLCGPKPSARFAIALAEHGFTANVPLAAIEGPNALVLYEADGEPLTPDHGWPVRLFVPTKFFWKSAKWLTGIELSAVDRPGFWERYGYHNDADYWQEQRYGL